MSDKLTQRISEINSFYKEMNNFHYEDLEEIKKAINTTREVMFKLSVLLKDVSLKKIEAEYAFKKKKLTVYENSVGATVRDKEVEAELKSLDELKRLSIINTHIDNLNRYMSVTKKEMEYLLSYFNNENYNMRSLSKGF